MKYIEELKPGDTFVYESIFYILTIDYKKNNYKLCFGINDGCPKWFSPECIVKEVNLYIIDEFNNIIPIKDKNTHAIQKN